MSEVKSIAIIDDDASVLDATENLVRSYGFKVSKFTSAESYLASVGDIEIDCLITDVQMDGISGVELSQILWESGVKTPIIFITAFPDERIRNRVMAAGAIGFLGKPFESKSLIDCIERALTN
ncbi:response regulator [Phyllobacterium sp. OV277]|uniref:response regulator n=1 Tax=Phyllobacterium sp. OV277 TaxID=1882772 RepID=UPI000886A7DE|nr:response regulator [Phyllobacterium sp. OV277]SDP82100.1 Response regulator receiver domain-containing protein [Phyllobacterium sp. OV277]